MNKAHRLRRGGAMIVALVALLVVSLVVAVLLRSLVELHRQSRRNAWQLQAGWLADSALARGAAQLTHNRDFAGETWSPELGDAQKLRGSVQIRVESVPDQPDRRKMTIEAIFPDDPIQRASASRELLFTLPPAGETS
jgi:Tfp pilus assembly protein PilX